MIRKGNYNAARFKANKYGARRVSIDGFTFDSEMEARRYGQLKMLQLGNLISDLRIHPRYPLEINGEHVCTYIADADYRENGELVVEDTKGKRTALYILKKKLMKAIHGIEVKEVRA